MELFHPLPGPWSKNLFYKRFFVWSKEFKINYKTGNGIIQTGNWIIFSNLRPLIKKPLLLNIYHLIQGVQNYFQNRKWNYPNWKWNYFFHFVASDQKTSFTKYFSFSPIFTYFPIFSPIFTYFHLFSPIFTYFHLFSPIFTYFHKFS